MEVHPITSFSMNLTISSYRSACSASLARYTYCSLVRFSGSVDAITVKSELQTTTEDRDATWVCSWHFICGEKVLTTAGTHDVVCVKRTMTVGFTDEGDIVSDKGGIITAAVWAIENLKLSDLMLACNVDPDVINRVCRYSCLFTSGSITISILRPLRSLGPFLYPYQATLCLFHYNFYCQYHPLFKLYIGGTGYGRVYPDQLCSGTEVLGQTWVLTNTGCKT